MQPCKGDILLLTLYTLILKCILVFPCNLYLHVCSFAENDPIDEDVDIGGNEPPVSSYPPVEIEKDAGHRINKCLSPRSASGKLCLLRVSIIIWAFSLLGIFSAGFPFLIFLLL